MNRIYLTFISVFLLLPLQHAKKQNGSSQKDKGGKEYTVDAHGKGNAIVFMDSVERAIDGGKT